LQKLLRVDFVKNFDKTDFESMSLEQYELTSQTLGLQNLYLSSLVSTPPQLYEYD